MNKYNYLILSFLMLLSIRAVSQTFEENVSYGDNAFADGDYYTASQHYKEAIDIKKSDLQIVYKYAESCRLTFDYKEAENYYSYISSKDKKNNFPLSCFWLAMMNKNNGKYIEAKKNFRTYYEKHKTDNNYFSRKALCEIYACEFALKALKDTIPVKIEHLDTNINTKYSESGATQIKGEFLYFSSLRPILSKNTKSIISQTYLSKIYKSRLRNDKWSLNKEIDPKINDKKTHNANIFFNKNNDKIYFTRCAAKNGSQIQCAIYVCKYEKGNFQKPVKLNNKINLPGYTSTQPCVESTGEDKDILYFVSDRPNGYGKLDIWYSVIEKDKYSEPVNLGSNVNSYGNEITPFYRSATKTLYFSSDWHKGLGGYDIFESKGIFTQWSLPKNIGFPINSRCNDLYFTVNQLDTNGYFASNRVGSLHLKGETCCYDIYSYKLIKKEHKKKPAEIKPKEIVSITPEKVEEVKKVNIIKKTNIKSEINELLPLTLYFHNDEPDKATTKIFTNKNYKTTINEYLSLEYKYKKEYSKGLTGYKKQKAEKDIEDFFNDYVINGFKNLEKFTVLLLKDLEKGNDVKITIKGFCSPLSTNKYNINLAKRRISSVKNYIYEYNNGVFLKYLYNKAVKGAKLSILEAPIGEEQASPLVSDNPNDKKSSVYSCAAAYERRVQIIKYNY
jgi:hypothetical protein